MSVMIESLASTRGAIAVAMRDMPLMRHRCPGGFAPLADAVEYHTRPLF
jgi:hypothetical protein